MHSGSIYVCTADITFGFQSTTAKSKVFMREPDKETFILCRVPYYEDVRVTMIISSSLPASESVLLWLLHLVQEGGSIPVPTAQTEPPEEPESGQTNI